MKKQQTKIIGIILLASLFANLEFAFANTIPYEAKKIITKGNYITIEVLGNKYKAQHKEGESLYQVMKNLSEKKNSKFSFHSKNYSSLGNFIDEINGVKGTPGRYWIYYINNKKASVGVSKYFVKSGDIINWKQEGI